MKDGFPLQIDTELRQTTRMSVSWRARVATDGQSFLDSRTFDISLGGVGLLCGSALALGTSYLVALQLPPTATQESRVITARAKVVFQILSGREYRVGLQWTDPADPALDALGDWSVRR